MARDGLVLWNLICNADKFTPPGGRIDVRFGKRPVRRYNHQRERMPAPGFLKRIFDAFQQSGRAPGRSRARTRHQQTIVDLHSDSIDAESEGLGRGAKFVVQLPTAAEG